MTDPSTGADLTLTVLGCCGSYAGPGGACSGYLVSSPETKVWLDAGPGTLGPLQTHVALEDLDAVVLSHSHPDRWLELPVLANALGYVIQRDRLPVYSNAATFERAKRVVDDAEQMADIFDWTVIDDHSEVTIGDQRWTFRSTVHYVPTHAARCSVGDKAITYSADTGPGWSPTAFGEPVGLFLCESSFAHRRGNEDIEHLSGAEAGRLAAEAEADRLVLTHVSPREDRDACASEAATMFSGPIDVAAAGAIYHA